MQREAVHARIAWSSRNDSDPNGTILRFADVGGSYTVNEDCTGTITFVTDVHLDIFIAPHGKEFYLIQTDPSSVLATVARRVSRQ